MAGNIPTSFVPHGSSRSGGIHSSDFAGAFAFIAYAILFLMVVAAIGVFIYGRILTNEQQAKAAQLSKAAQAVDSRTAQKFVTLQTQLNQASQLLKQHVAYSTFLSALAADVPQTVQLSSLSVTSNKTGSTTMTAQGIAKNLDAIANFSANLASSSGPDAFSGVTFSNFGVNAQKGGVSFGLQAVLGSSLFAFTPPAVTPAGTSTLQAAPNTATTSTTTKP